MYVYKYIRFLNPSLINNYLVLSTAGIDRKMNVQKDIDINLNEVDYIPKTLN